ncbi:MAG: hypothetical protein ACRDOI_40645 [Trebonia sp.]
MFANAKNSIRYSLDAKEEAHPAYEWTRSVRCDDEEVAQLHADQREVTSPLPECVKEVASRGIDPGRCPLRARVQHAGMSGAAERERPRRTRTSGHRTVTATV